jgi:hypothetical protein
MMARSKDRCTALLFSVSLTLLALNDRGTSTNRVILLEILTTTLSSLQVVQVLRGRPPAQ